jgi:hypothetical protein
MNFQVSTSFRGIYLVRDLSEVVYDQPYILQQYIQRPLTVNGFKFDLRYRLFNCFLHCQLSHSPGFMFLCYQCILL